MSHPPAAPGTGPGAPVPPPGPGVVVPFGAPPTERDRKRLWIGLGVGGALLVLCCVGGVLGIGALVVESNRAVQRSATTVVGDYLEGLRTADYDQSYDQLCAAIQASLSREDFKSHVSDAPQVRGYSVGAPRTQGSQLTVPAQVQYSDGTSATRVYRVVPEGSVGSVKICGGGL